MNNTNPARVYQASLSKLPVSFLERLQKIVPQDKYDACVESFVKPRMTTFRINTLKGNPEDIIRAVRKEHIHAVPSSWHSLAFSVNPAERDALVRSSSYEQGLIYVQNYSSMVPPLVLAPEPGERVLDLTAAPGSKTAQMAAIMANKGEIVAVDNARSRFYKLLRNLEIQGVGNTQAVCTNGEFFWRHNMESFDRVLLDAPCTTEGRFHIDEPETYAYWKERKIKEMVRKQNRLFFSAVRCLKVGGVMVYSTCSFAPEENEGILQRQLEKIGNAVEVEKVRLPFRNTQNPLQAWKRKTFDERISRALRILPTREMEAFFVCRIRKTGSVG